jgi:hypothetical protein
MVLGLSQFSFVDAYEDIPAAFESRFSDAAEDALLMRDPHFDAATSNGKEINEYLASSTSPGDVTDLLINLFGKRICHSSEDAKQNCSQVSTQP